MAGPRASTAGRSPEARPTAARTTAVAFAVLCLPALPATADPFVEGWLARCRAAEPAATCIRDAYEGLCGYGPDPALCRAGIEARLTNEVWTLRADGIPAPDWRPPYRCDDPPPQMSVAGCEAIVLGSLVEAWLEAAR